MIEASEKVNIRDSSGSGRANARPGKNHVKRFKAGKAGMAFKGVSKIQLRKGYLDEKKNWIIFKNFDEVIGCVTAVLSVVGFAFGGTGLIYDSIMKRKNAKKNGVSGAVSLKRDAKPGFSSYSSYNRDVSAGVPALLNQLTGKSSGTATSVSPLIIDAMKYNKPGYRPTGSNAKGDAKGDSGEAGTGEGYGDYTPITGYGKAGLGTAKVALAVSGTAGALTGIATHVPLMVAGELIGNVLAAPIINSYAGFGLLNIGLAALFSGRALEKNVNTTLDPVKFAAKTPIEKVGYVAENIWKGMKVTGKSMTEVGKNFGRLLSFANKEKMAEGAHFFKTTFFGLKPNIIQFEQSMHTNRTTKAATKMVSNPHFLQFGASLLAISGVVMIGEYLLEKMGVIKNKKSVDKAREVCFTGGKVGQVADNLGLAKYGMQRMAQGAPILGVPVALAGATLLGGTPHADKDYGKGIQWVGLAYFFALLAMERALGWKKVHLDKKALKMAEAKFKEVSELVKANDLKKLKELAKAGGHKSVDALKAAVKPAMVDQTAGFVKSMTMDISHAPGVKGKDLENVMYALKANDPAWSEFVSIGSKKGGRAARLEMLRRVRKAQRDLMNSENPFLRGIVAFTKEANKELTGKHYNAEYSAKDLIRDMRAKQGQHKVRIIPKEVFKYAHERLEVKSFIPQGNVKNVKQGNVKDVIKANIYKDAAQGGKGYKEQVLDPLLKDKNTPKWAREAIEDAKKNKKISKMLEVE